MLIALSDAAKANIAIIGLWVVLFPALVTGLIAFAVAQSVAERSENFERRSRRSR